MTSATAPPPSILRRLLVAAGYRLEDSGPVIVAVRAADHRAVVIAPRGQSPATVEPLFPSSVVHRTIVYDEEPGDPAREAAAARGIELLGPSTLGPALGEILLPSVLVPGTVGPLEGEDDPLESPFPPVAAGARTVRPRIGRREAQAIAGLADARYTLRLVPFYAAAYRVRSVAPDGGPGAVRHGLVAVNATTRRAEIWTEGARELVTDVEGPAERLNPQLSEAGAEPLAVEAIRRHHTVRVDHTEQHAGAIVVESRRVPPPVANVRLGPFSLIFVPFWYAETAGGRAILDAVSGRGATDAETHPG
ncbi:MAG TPA: hypothetical protein VEH57_02725 [Thermoplasmata archaeon]|nr:hypothetical protein [Thermoplasmata archaeon]